MQLTSKERLKRRHFRVRKKVSGTAARPRLYVRRSLKHIYVQIIDDSPEVGSKTLLTVTTWSKETAGKHFANANGAKALGGRVAEALKAHGLTTVVFDRGGYRYHGVVKTLAETVRESGITI